MIMLQMSSQPAALPLFNGALKYQSEWEYRGVNLHTARALYLTDVCAFIQRPHCVCVVLRHTIHTQRLLVLLTVKRQRLQVEVAEDFSARGGSPVTLPKEARGGAAERAVRDGLLLLVRLSAQRTLVADLPALLLTLPAEAVGARQQHGVLKDALTHRAGEVLLEGEGVLWHFLVHVSHDSKRNSGVFFTLKTKQKHRISCLLHLTCLPKPKNS